MNCVRGTVPFLRQLKAWTLRGPGRCVKDSPALSKSKAGKCSAAYREVSVVPEGETS